MKQQINNKRIGNEIRIVPKTVHEIPKEKLKSNWLIHTLKVFGVIIATAGLSTSLVSVGSTVSFFNDTEISIGNYFRAEPLSFTVNIASSTSAMVDITSGSGGVVPIMLPVDGSAVIQYMVKGNLASGDALLCNAINTLGTFPFPLDGNLATVISGTTTTTGHWTLVFSLPDPTLFSNKSCTVNLVYEGWNAELPYGTGFRDARTVSITFNVGETTPQLQQSQSFVGDAPIVDAPLIVVPEEENKPDPKVEEVLPPVTPVVEVPEDTPPPPVPNVASPLPIVEPTPEVITGPIVDDANLPPVVTTETPAL